MSGPVRNRVKERMAAGQLSLCIGTRLARTGDVAMIAQACGFDALYVDMEHSTASIETAAQICLTALAIGLTPLVRTPGHQPHEASRLLDGGALGIIYPHVNTPDEAEAFVAACKFPPIGHRSVGGSGPAQLYRPIPLGEVNRIGNDTTLCVAMIETPQGVANADAIAAVPGIDILLIGSNDLCTEMGFPGETHRPELQRAYETVAAACKAHGKHLGIGGIRGDAALTAKFLGLGATFMISGMDVTYLAAAARKDAETIRALVQA